MSISILSINSKNIGLMKSVRNPDYTSKTILTNSPWEFVELWLRRQTGERAKRALFFWIQAKHFYLASTKLPVESKPLTSYYCCLNASKALLAIHGSSQINLNNIAHGISFNREKWKGYNIKNAIVTFNGGGVLYELSKYFEEEACKKDYIIYDLLYNIPCVHRPFSITYNCPELFIPIHEVNYLTDSEKKKGWIQFYLDDQYANAHTLRNISKKYQKLIFNEGGKYWLKRNSYFDWDIHDKNYKKRIENLKTYHNKVRKDILFVYGNEKQWYLKKEVSKDHLINRCSITLIYSVMHWLSELVRYLPETFDKLMKTKQNWIIHDFIENSLYQFIDEISCEITKEDIKLNYHL